MRDTVYSSFVEVQRKILKNYALSFNGHYSARKGIILYLEYHSVCPLVRNRIGSAHPLSHKQVCHPPPPEKRGSNTRLRVRGWADPNRTTEEKARLFVCSVILAYKCIVIL